MTIIIGLNTEKAIYLASDTMGNDSIIKFHCNKFVKVKDYVIGCSGRDEIQLMIEDYLSIKSNRSKLKLESKTQIRQFLRIIYKKANEAAKEVWPDSKIDDDSEEFLIASPRHLFKANRTLDVLEFDIGEFAAVGVGSTAGLVAMEILFSNKDFVNQNLLRITNAIRAVCKYQLECGLIRGAPEVIIIDKHTNSRRIEKTTTPRKAKPSRAVIKSLGRRT